MTDVYLTFKGTTTGVVDAFYEKQALADAGATDDDITAVQGVKTVPDNYRANKAYWDGTKVLSETPESVVLDALTDAEWAEGMKVIIGQVALDFDAGLKAHWEKYAASGVSQPFHTTLTVENTWRMDNTMDWGRSWIGWAWREVTRLVDDHADKLTRANIVNIVDRCKSEMPNVKHILFWYINHHAENWAGWLFKSGMGADLNRIMYWTDLSHDGTGSVFTTPTGTFTGTEWGELLTTHYQAALKSAA